MKIQIIIKQNRLILEYSTVHWSILNSRSSTQTLVRNALPSCRTDDSASPQPCRLLDGSPLLRVACLGKGADAFATL